MFRTGNRWMAAGCILMLLEAAAHTFGFSAPLPDDPTLQSVVAGMKGFAEPMGLGMSPSFWDIFMSLGYAMSVSLVTFGVIGLSVLAAAPDDKKTHRTIATVLLGANIVMLAMWYHYRIPPPLISQLVVTPCFVASLLWDRKPA